MSTVTGVSALPDFFITKNQRLAGVYLGDLEEQTADAALHGGDKPRMRRQLGDLDELAVGYRLDTRIPSRRGAARFVS